MQVISLNNLRVYSHYNQSNSSSENLDPQQNICLLTWSCSGLNSFSNRWWQTGQKKNMETLHSLLIPSSCGENQSFYCLDNPNSLDRSFCLLKQTSLHYWCARSAEDTLLLKYNHKKTNSKQKKLHVLSPRCLKPLRLLLYGW